MPTLSSAAGALGYGRPQKAAYKYYRWQITSAKTMPPDANCAQASEFLFILNSTAQQSTTSGATVTNPSGSNPVGETPPNLVDGSLTTKALDLNFVTNGNITNFIFQFSAAQAFTGYRWATANDFETRDPASWTLSGSQDGTNWTLLHSVSNYVATSSRSVYNSATWEF